MQRFGILVLTFLWLLAGCGGNKQVVSQAETKAPINTESETALDFEDEKEESLVGDINSQRLEEQYSKASIPGLDQTLEQEMRKWELQKTFDMPIQVNKEVRNYIYYFSTDRKQIFSRYLSRSSRYLPMIKKVFAEYGLPEDLAYLAMVESGFSNKAKSTANAVGMWQFIKGTGSRYGLAINSAIDERRDPEKATRAAAEYLLDLYKQFGSWYLAAASYNCGEGRVQKEINRNSDLKNFWELSNNYCLPNETKNYVPQIIAATIIAKNPEKYGFKNIPYQPPLKYEVVKVTEPTSLRAAAVAATTNYEEISALNPELLRDATPAGYSTYLLKIPPGKKEAFDRNIVMARAQFPAGSGAYYAAREDSGDSAEYSSSRRSARTYREYASSSSSSSSTTRRLSSATKYRTVAAAKPKARAELRERTKVYADLPRLAAKNSTPAPAVASTQRSTKSSTTKDRKEILVASTAPRSLKEQPTRASSTREAPRRAEKAEAPMTASMLPASLSSAKKTKKEAPSIARKPETNSKNKKKKKDDS